MMYQGPTTGRYPNGKRVWLFFKRGGGWAHLEVFSRAFGWYR